MTGQLATVVLVHGAWHGAWCWDAVVRCLDAARVPSVAVDNPSVARAPSSLADDGDQVRQVLDAIDGPVVLVGHSYGGAVITDAGSHDAVRRLVYLTAFVLDDGESLMRNDLAGGAEAKLAEAVAFGGDVVRFDPARSVEFLFHDCAPAVASAAGAQLRPQSLSAMAGVPRSIAWREKAASYVLCTDDRALPVALQQANADRIGGVTAELATSHSPFLSQPEELAQLLVSFSRDC